MRTYLNHNCRVFSLTMLTASIVAFSLLTTSCSSKKNTTKSITAEAFINRGDKTINELPHTDYQPNKNKGGNKGGNKNDDGGSGVNTTGGTTASTAELKRMGTKLGLTLTSDNNAKLYQEVCSWIGTPYRYGGTSKSGVDCSGFTGNIYKAVYSVTLTRQSSGILQNDCKKVSKANLKEGDLVFFRTDGKSTSTPNHVGVYLTDGKFAHASTSKGVMVSSLSSSYYLKCFLTGGRVNKGNSHAFPGGANRPVFKIALDKAVDGDVMDFTLDEDGEVEDCPEDIVFIADEE